MNCSTLLADMSALAKTTCASFGMAALSCNGLAGKMLLDVRRIAKVFLFQRVTHVVVRTQRCTVIFPEFEKQVVSG